MVSIGIFIKVNFMSRKAENLPNIEFPVLDHSHFQLVIERLQQASQAEDAYADDEVGRTSKKEDEEEGLVESTTQAKVRAFWCFLFSSAKIILCFVTDRVNLQCKF